MLIACSECGKEISSSANKCPNCGATTQKRIRTTSRTLIILGILLSLFGASIYTSGTSYIANAPDVAESIIESSEQVKLNKENFEYVEKLNKKLIPYIL